MKTTAGQAWWRKIGTLRDVAERLSAGRLDQAALSELLTIAGQIVAGTSFDPQRIAERYWRADGLRVGREPIGKVAAAAAGSVQNSAPATTLA